MNFKNETDLIKVLGWSKSSKMIFILRMINNNMTKEDIYKELVEDNGLMKTKSFKTYWNQIDRIKESIQFV